MSQVKKYYFELKNSSNGQSFEIFSTSDNANEILVSLRKNDEGGFWNMKSGEHKIFRYNKIVSSEDYKLEIEKFERVYSGTNLLMRVNRYHKLLGIRPLEGRSIFETIKL